MNEENRWDGDEKSDSRPGKFRPGNRRPRSSKEWRLIEKLLQKSLDDQKSSRRWGIFFKSLTFIYLFAILFMFSPGQWQTGTIKKETGKHVGLVDVTGMIAADEEANADTIVTGIRDAFEADNSVALIVRVNSPGGSPVQSAMVFDEVMRLRAKYPEKKVYAAITDLGASGAYFIASAADEIYADASSIVGSIGVISPGFGFTRLMDKVGVERRVYSAGDNKSMLDPFMPIEDDQKEHFQELLSDVHDEFIANVQKGRGDRLKDDPDVFSGLFWTGKQAMALGLVDGLGSPGFVAREVIGEENVVNYTFTPNPVDSFFRKMGLQLSKGILTSLGLNQPSMGI